MTRRPTERDLLTAFSAAGESDDGEELVELLQGHAATIASALGISAAQLEAISKAPPMDRTVKVRVALRRFRERHAESLRRQAQNLSIAAADMLVGLSRWHQERVDIDARIVLGTLLADRQRKAIRFASKPEKLCHCIARQAEGSRSSSSFSPTFAVSSTSAASTFAGTADAEASFLSIRVSRTTNRAPC